ncbi:hypothetical protein RJ640_010632 [Escallonia rubra]|uniref:UBN2_2 domain-containing protein n=1 Tax=Escallonia rubra TaxID=112253 RepID=A0AA88SE69_9ASTE|nr:hypothetical protein RJ640_010632 [Escallonia rubra]
MHGLIRPSLTVIAVAAEFLQFLLTCASPKLSTTHHDPQMVAAPDKPPQKFLPPCETQEKALSLIEAYSEKWCELCRGYLCTIDWDAVAASVEVGLSDKNSQVVKLGHTSHAAITGYLSSIESLSCTNFRKWKEQSSIILGVMDLNYALQVDAHAALTAESSTEQKAAYEKWEHSNSTSLMIMKGYITTAIRGAIPDSDNAKLYFAHIEEQFQGSSNAHATTLITRMVTLKYSGSNGFREHILRMNDMTSQLKSLDMEISKGFLVHFIMTFLPAQFGPFKINYNTQKEKEREVEDERVDFHVYPRRREAKIQTT